MLHVAVIAPTFVFIYGRDYNNIARSDYTGTKRMRVSDPYGSMTRVDIDDDVPEPAAYVRPGRYAYDEPFDRKSRGKGVTLRSLRDPRSIGGDNRKAAVQKVSIRIVHKDILGRTIRS